MDAQSAAAGARESALRAVIEAGLAEDLGSDGDVTTWATVPAALRRSARFLAKADGVVAGLAAVEMVFAAVSGGAAAVRWDVRDGDRVRRGQVFGAVEGPARALLVGERLALNLLQRMSGIATATAAMVERCRGTGAVVLDTRKTAPGLRVADKWAVEIGGGSNHRHGLYDMVMIKDNHVSAAGGVRNAVRAVRRSLAERGLSVPVEVETRTLAEVRDVVAEFDEGGGGVDRVMLDNMSCDTMREAIAIIGGRIKTEASGNVTLDTIGEIARSGVDYISSGALTHSVIALDISLKIDLATASL